MRKASSGKCWPSASSVTTPAQWGKRAEDLIEAGTKSRTLAQVDGMTQFAKLRDPRRRLEDVLELRPTAVVNKNDPFKELRLGKLPDDIQQLQFRPVRWDEATKQYMQRPWMM